MYDCVHALFAFASIYPFTVVSFAFAFSSNSKRCAGKFNYVETLPAKHNAQLAALPLKRWMGRWVVVYRHKIVEQCYMFDMIQAKIFTINNQSKMFVELLLVHMKAEQRISFPSSFARLAPFNHTFHLSFPFWHLVDWKAWKINTHVIFPLDVGWHEKSFCILDLRHFSCSLNFWHR